MPPIVCNCGRTFAPQGYASHLKVCTATPEVLAADEAIKRTIEAQQPKDTSPKPAGQSRKAPRLELARKENQPQTETNPSNVPLHPRAP
ncbi:hypothetical protein H0H92_009584 [Tricholoma furcatifolium]|nr:hypothetical protein H0H92_009584 [Tricholoma furcatifolium]